MMTDHRKPIWQPRWYDFVAYWIVMILPNGRWNFPLLPYAGRWDHRNDPTAPLYPGQE